MIHHLSIPAEDPALVAKVIAGMLGGHVTKFGPYHSSFIAWAGNEHGAAIEVYLAGTDPRDRFAKPHEGGDPFGCEATRLEGSRAVARLATVRG